MKHARLLSTVAAGLLLSTAAFAQAPSKDNNPANAAPAPAAQQNAPPEKVAPNMKAGKPDAETHKAPGQSPAAQNAPKPGNPDKAIDKGSMEKSTQNAPLRPSDANGNGKPNAAQNAAPEAAPKATTTGQGSAAGAGATAKLSTEQRTRITTVFKQHRIEPAQLNVSINVGTRVPNNVHFYPVPQDVVVIYPEWRGYDYILVGDQIVILDPRSHEIVAVLEA